MTMVFDAKPTKVGGSRCAALDALRGQSLIMMGLNHVPNNLDSFTNHPMGFVSSPEGFVFISGLVGGLVYGRRWLRKGPEAVRQACRARALTIYAYQIAACIMVFCWMALCRFWTGGSLPPNAPTLMAHSPWEAFSLAVVMLYQPSLLDLLPMYCVFLFLLPAMLRAFEAGRRRWVLGGSFALWAASNIFLPQNPLTLGDINLGAFNIFSWQLIFVTGAMFGHAWCRREAWVLALPRWLFWPAVAMCVWGFSVRHAWLPAGLPAAWLGWLTNKNNLAPLRLVNAAALYYLIRNVVAWQPGWFMRRPLIFLGQHSLQVFTAHVLAVYFINAFPVVFATTAPGRWLAMVIILAWMFGAAGLHAAWRYIVEPGAAPTPARAAAPIGLAEPAG